MSVAVLAAPSLPRMSRRKDDDRDASREAERQLLIRYHLRG